MHSIQAKQIIALICLSLCLLIMQSCSTVATKAPPKKIAKKHKNNNPPNFENFDRKPFPNESFVIANMIAVVQPELDSDERDTIASQISLAINKHKIEPQIVVAIIDTESDFQADRVSPTGDISLAQINVEVWNREFIRMKLPPLDKEKIKSDQEYALLKMAEILSIIKKRYEKRDRRWYARYHSNTNHYKLEYLNKLERRLRLLALSPRLVHRVAQGN